MKSNLIYWWIGLIVFILGFFINPTWLGIGLILLGGVCWFISIYISRRMRFKEEYERMLQEHNQ